MSGGAPRRLLLVGGTGYLGGRLALALAATGWELGIAARSRRAWPEGLRAAFQPLELPAPQACLAPLVAGYDAVVNLAAANELLAAANPARALAVTAEGAAALLAAARTAGVRRFLQLSTLHVYGQPAGSFDESLAPAPCHPYALAHRAAEEAVQRARREGFDARILRLGNVVGAPASPAVERWTLLGNDLCRQAVLQRRLRLRGDGLAWRSFLPLTAALAAIRHLLDLPQAAEDGLYHLGGPARQVIELARQVARLAGVPLETGPPEASGPPFAPDYRRLAESGCAPALELEPALVETLAFCRRHAAALAGSAAP